MMTTGHLILYSGIALLGVTVVLAIVFLIVRPKYKPENAVYDTSGSDTTQHLRNGFPTERVTIRRDKPVETAGGITVQDADKTEIISGETDVLNCNHTSPSFEKERKS